MILEIRKRIEQELNGYLRDVDSLYRLSRISPLLFGSIKEFLSRQGKRVRPTLFVLGYMGLAPQAAPGLYRSAVSIELLHDFMLVHDDIIDKSATRRGRPSMHAMLEACLRKEKQRKFSGEDLAIVAGDVMFAMAMDAFLAIREDPRHKEEALRRLIRAALYTGGGEFIELIYGITPLERLTQQDIYRVYDLKTANYTFASPLAIGATLAGASRSHLATLSAYGTYLGRAFQIKDDILGLCSEEKEIGKSSLTDLKEGKKTLLIWKAYQNAGPQDKKRMRAILEAPDATRAQLLVMRRIVTDSGSLLYAQQQVRRLKKKAETLLRHLHLRLPVKAALSAYAGQILTI